MNNSRIENLPDTTVLKESKEDEGKRYSVAIGWPSLMLNIRFNRSSYFLIEICLWQWAEVP